MQKTTNSTENEIPAQIGKPAHRALAAAGYTQLSQLAQVSEAELLKLHGFGPKALRILRETLTTKGLSFADPVRK